MRLTAHQSQRDAVVLAELNLVAADSGITRSTVNGKERALLACASVCAITAEGSVGGVGAVDARVGGSAGGVLVSINA